jgi:hypothetical protein
MNVPVVALAGLVAGRMAPARDDLCPMSRSDSGHAEQGFHARRLVTAPHPSCPPQHMGWPFLSRGNRPNHPKNQATELASRPLDSAMAPAVRLLAS